MASTGRVTRAEVVGSLLQPEEVLLARQAVAAGTLGRDELHAIEDAAVIDAIATQESVGLDVITDGELRRQGWSLTRNFLDGLEPRVGPRSYPNSVHEQERLGAEATFPTVVHKITEKPGEQIAWEYPFLKAHATTRTKYTIAAPSYHRRYWSDTYSTDAYESAEAFLTDVRDWMRGVIERLISEGCDYVQLDAPNYGTLCDPESRAYHERLGHDVSAQIRFDAALDSSVFDGLDVTGAIHICRGNLPGGSWHSSGGYAAIADDLFPAIDIDVMLLEYDSDRAGDFGPLAQIRPDTVAVLGLLTTKEAALEDPRLVEERIAEASKIKAIDRLALSTQCGFASSLNAPMTADEQRAKLELVADVAHRIWSEG
jgi:5-methyltetrahydropteroyltriglutamate--homocysteine methyltransferase